VPPPTLTRHTAAGVINALMQLDAKHDLIV